MTPEPPEPLAPPTPTGLYLDRAPTSMHYTGVSNYRGVGRSEKVGVKTAIIRGAESVPPHSLIGIG